MNSMKGLNTRPPYLHTKQPGLLPPASPRFPHAILLFAIPLSPVALLSLAAATESIHATLDLDSDLRRPSALGEDVYRSSI